MSSLPELKQLRAAYALAEAHHADHIGPDGLPYIAYLTGVSTLVARYGADTRVAALLKDVLVDADCRAEDLLGYPLAVVQAVALLTYNAETEDYTTDYIASIISGDSYAHRIAQIVTLADLKFMLLGRPDGLAESRYHYAQERIHRVRHERGLGGLRV